MSNRQLLLGTSTVAAGGSIYYVSSAGSDAANGTSTATSWQTIAKVNSSSFSGGAQILFNKGDTWRETLTVPSSGSSGSPIIFGAYGSGAAPVITGANSMTGFSDGGSNIWDKTSVTTQPKVVVVGANLPKPMAASRAACTAAGDWFWTANTLSVYATSDPSGTVEANQRGSAVTTNSKTYLTFDGLTIRGGNTRTVRIGETTSVGITFQNCTVETGATHGFSLFVSGTANTLLINACTIQNNGGPGIEVSNDYTSGTISNNTMSRNGFLSLFDGISYSGIMNKLGNLSIFGNDINNQSPYGGSNAGTPGIFCHGIYWFGGDFTLTANIYNNEIYDNDYGHGIKVDGSCNVFRNLVYGNAGDGILVGSNSTSNVVYAVYYNIVYGNNSGNSSAYNGITQSNKGAGTLSLSLYNNVVYQNAGTQTAEVRINQDVTVLNLKNNILFTTATRRSIDIEATQTGTVSINNNVHWRADGNPNIWYTTGRTWATWQGFGFDAAGLNADPLFNNAGASDFTLQPTSPAVNAGANLGSTYQAGLVDSTWPASVVTDNQNSWGGWEIGAYISTGYTMVASTGSFALTGNPVTFTSSANHVMTADTGSFVLTGNAVTFIDSGGSYSAAGANPTTGRTWTAEGFGASAQGGAQPGQVILVVDTLNDVDDSPATTAAGLLANKGADGKISLREACRVSGVRLVTFSVSGYLDLDSAIEVLTPNITIDGGDAPDQGVCTRGDAFVVRTGEVVLRYMRFRRGFQQDDIGGDVDSLTLLGDAATPTVYQDNIIVDHCTMAWGDDGNMDVNSRIRNITISWCLLYTSGGTGHTYIGTGGDGCNINALGPTQMSFHHNLFAGGGSRSPEVGSGDLDWVNNVIYRNCAPPDCGGGFTNMTSFAPYDGPAIRVNLIKNYYKPGNDENISIHPLSGQARASWTDCSDANPSGVFFQDNWGVVGGTGTMGVCADVDIAELDVGAYVLSGSRFSFPAVTTTSAAQAYIDVIAGVGCRLPCLDTADLGILADIAAGTYEESNEPSGGIPWVPPYGGWPDLTDPCP